MERRRAPVEKMAEKMAWIVRPGGVVEIGHPAPGASGEPFAFDNESPRHAALLTPHALASRLVAAGEYLAFVRDGGYRRPELWLSDGWAEATAGHWEAPLYWSLGGGDGSPGGRCSLSMARAPWTPTSPSPT